MCSTPGKQSVHIGAGSQKLPTQMPITKKKRDKEISEMFGNIEKGLRLLTKCG